MKKKEGASQRNEQSEAGSINEYNYSTASCINFYTMKKNKS